jgi:FAD/FMN-containing dehydrogenase
MEAEWSNWSGSLKFTPASLYKPEDEGELEAIVKKSFSQGQKIRLAGAGHSSTPLVVTPHTLISLEHFKNVGQVDIQNSTAWVGAGLTVKEAGVRLLEHGLSLHNTGDVDVQTVAGAISTGTHGTGIKLKNLSSMLIGCRLITAEGEIKEFTEEKDGKDFFDAMRLSLGSFGLMAQMKLQLMPKFKLARKEWCAHIDDCLENLDSLIAENRNFDFYWYPRNDLVKLRTLNEPGKEPKKYTFASIVEEKVGWAIEVLPKERDLKFDEMEYCLPLGASVECFKVVRKMIKEKFRRSVAWRLLIRTIQADDSYISPFFGRDTVTISLHQNAGLPFWEYFKEIEPVFLDFGGRPHWGKKHTLKAKDLKPHFPKWNQFLAIREKMDPEGVFLNEHLKQLFFENGEG